jgi:hypothetical protein
MQGECVIVHSKDWEADDMAEISARLKSVSPGAACQEFSLRFGLFFQFVDPQ